MGIIGLLLLLACNPPYNIDYPTPKNFDNMQNLLPSFIDRKPAFYECGQIEQNCYGCDGYYVDTGRITMVDCLSEESAETQFFKRQDALETKQMQNSSFGNTSWAKYQLMDNKVGFLWRNTDWIYEIVADTEAQLHRLITEFEYISIE